MLLNALIKEVSPGYPNTSVYVVPYLFIIIPHLMRVLLYCLLFLKSRFLIFCHSSGDIHGEDLLFFSLSRHVYSQFPEIENYKLPTSHLGHPEEKQDGRVSLLCHQ